MPASVAEIISITASISGSVPERFNFGAIGFLATHTITRNRRDGPYEVDTDAIADGFTESAAPEVLSAIRAALGVEGAARAITIGRRVPTEGDGPGIACSVDVGTPNVLADMTAEARDDTDADVVAFPATEAVGDQFVIGHEIPFSRIVSDYANGTAGVDGAVDWQYWNGAAWVDLEGVTDATAGFTTAAADGLVTSFTRPADWAAVSASSLLGQAAAESAFGATESARPRYWIAATITTVYSTNPVLDQVFVGGNETLTSALSEIDLLHGGDWAYGLSNESRVQADLESFSTACNSRFGIYYAQTSDLTALLGTAGNVAENIAATETQRTAVFWHQGDPTTPNGYIDCAAMSKSLGTDLDAPGANKRIHMKTLQGITPDDSMTTAQAQNLFGNNVNVYNTIRGVVGVLKNTLAAGAPFFIDVRIFADWLIRRIEEDWAAFLNTNDPGQDIDGAAQAANVVESRIAIGRRNGLFKEAKENPEKFPFRIDADDPSLSTSLERQTRNYVVSVHNLFFKGGIQSLSLTLNLEF